MKKLLRLPLRINKLNGQVQTYFKYKELPREILESIKKQPTALKKLLLEYRGYE